MPEPLDYGVYISGPMQHVPEFNFPLFNKVAKYIAMDQAPIPGKAPKGTAWLVYPINPAFNFGGDTSLSREVYLELALRQVDEAKAIVLLPDWYNSPGARLELARALHNGADVYAYIEYDEHQYEFLPLSHEIAQANLDGTKQPVSDAPYVKVLPKGESPEQIEEEASRLVRNGKRQATYGHPRGDFDTIGAIWSAILTSHNKRQVDVPAEMVAVMMAGLKLARLSSSPGHRDSKVDTIGYMICLDRLDEPYGEAA